MTFICEYIRMVAYALIILASLRGISKRKFNSILFVGDIIMALILLVSGVLSKFGNIPRDLTRDMLLTPVVVIWAIIHFANLIKPIKRN
jgi:hypothetical protein